MVGIGVVKVCKVVEIILSVGDIVQGLGSDITGIVCILS